MRKNRISRYLLCAGALGLAVVVGVVGRGRLISSLEPRFLDFVDIGEAEAVADLLKHNPDLADRPCDYTYRLNAREVSVHDVRPLQLATYRQYRRIVAELLNAGARGFDAESPVSAPIHLAARNGNVDICKLLIRHGANVNEMDTGDGEDLLALRLDRAKAYSAAKISYAAYTPLHHAAIQGHVQVVDLLLANGASPDIQDSNGNTPLHLALAAERLDRDPRYLPVIRSLVLDGASLGTRNNLERSPMDEASARTRSLLMKEGWTTGSY